MHTKSKAKHTANPAPAKARKDTPKPSPATVEQPVRPSVEAVRLHAYRLWEAAGRPNGDGVNFWLDAERELFEAK